MKLLLLVQSEADVSCLEAAAKAILNSAITGVWVVFSPAITVNASEAAAKLDGEIGQLQSAERAAADRGDYTAAAGYKTQREGKELDRAKALRDAWKTAPKEERDAKTKAIFTPFMETLQARGGYSIKITGHSDHYEREQWVALLNSLSGVWFKPFTPGSFVVAWPESVSTAVRAAAAAPEVPAVSPTAVPSAAVRPPSRLDRHSELMSMKHFTLVGAAKKVNVEVKGKDKPTIVKEIIAAEFPDRNPVAVAETVDAY